MKTTRRVRGDKIYEYLSLVESIRVDGRNTHRTLLRLGEVTALRESGELERVITALSNHLERDQVTMAAMTAEDARSVGSIGGGGRGVGPARPWGVVRQGGRRAGR